MSDGSYGGPFIPLKTFHWGVIDHRLVRLKLTDLGMETRNRIKKDESRIRFENRLNTNTGTAHYQVLQMKVEAADEWARRVYEIYCAVWQTQGYEKSAAFVRAVAQTLSLMLGGQASSMAHAFLMYAKRTNFPGILMNAHLKELRLRMRQLQSKWERQLEAEARECEHAARRNTLTAAIPTQKSTHGEPRIPTTRSTASTTWDAIVILFLSDERVQVRHGTKSETLNYAEFGFEDGRSGKPNRAWAILRLLAEQRGMLQFTAKTGQDWTKVEKRIQEMRRALRLHFGIPTDPIPFTEGTGYRARFKISCRPSYDT